MRIRPNCVFNSRNGEINCTISIRMIGLNLIRFLLVLTIKARNKITMSPIQNVENFIMILLICAFVYKIQLEKSI